MNDEQLTQRMRAASDAIEMSDIAQARHMEAISAALTAEAGASVGNVVPLSGASRRRRIIASVVAAAVIAPTGLAAASEGSVPGDALYPVKQLSERVLVLFDPDVIALHRIEEIEALENSGRFDSELYDDARQALTELGEDHPLWDRLASSTEAAGDADDEDEGTVADDDDRSELEPLDSTTIEVVLPDGSEAVLMVGGGELLEVDPPAGWTVTELDGDEATLRTERFEVEVVLLPDGSISTEITDLRDDDSSTTTDGSEEDDADDDDSEGAGTEGDGTEASDDDVSEDPVTEPSTPSDEDEEDPEDEDDGSGDDDPSEGT